MSINEKQLGPITVLDKDGYSGSVDASKSIIINMNGLTINEREYSPTISASGIANVWVRDDSPNVLVFTDDTGVDSILGVNGIENVNATAGGLTSVETITSDLTGNTITIDLPSIKLDTAANANTIIGQGTPPLAGIGDNNTIIGDSSGSSTTGRNNSVVGHFAMSGTGVVTDNAVIGDGAATAGGMIGSVVVGQGAAGSTDEFSVLHNSVIMGRGALRDNTRGYKNTVIIGEGALLADNSLSAGLGGVYVGQSVAAAGAKKKSNEDVLIGYSSAPEWGNFAGSSSSVIGSVIAIGKAAAVAVTGEYHSGLIAIGTFSASNSSRGSTIAIGNNTTVANFGGGPLDSQILIGQSLTGVAGANNISIGTPGIYNSSSDDIDNLVSVQNAFVSREGAVMFGVSDGSILTAAALQTSQFNGGSDNQIPLGTYRDADTKALFRLDTTEDTLNGAEIQIFSGNRNPNSGGVTADTIGVSGAFSVGDGSRTVTDFTTSGSGTDGGGTLMATIFSGSVTAVTGGAGFYPADTITILEVDSTAGTSASTTVDTVNSPTATRGSIYYQGGTNNAIWHNTGGSDWSAIGGGSPTSLSATSVDVLTLNGGVGPESGAITIDLPNVKMNSGVNNLIIGTSTPSVADLGSVSGQVIIGPTAGPQLAKTLGIDNTIIGSSAFGNDSLTSINLFTENTIIGSNAAANISTVDAPFFNGNVVIGDKVVQNSSVGINNVIVGNLAGQNASSGLLQLNTWIGYQAGQNASLTEGTVFIGAAAGSSCSAAYNTLIGSGAGLSTSGESNTVVGDSAGLYLRAGTFNVLFGSGAQQGGTDTSDLTGNNNVVIGEVRESLGSGSDNVLINSERPSANISNYVNINGSFINDPNTAAVIIGKNASPNGGINSVTIGDGAGAANGVPLSSSILIGHNALVNSTSGLIDSVVIGRNSVPSLSSPVGFSVVIGNESGPQGTNHHIGPYNTIVGHQSGKGINAPGSLYNTFVGYQTGPQVTSSATDNIGENNTVIGSSSLTETHGLMADIISIGKNNGNSDMGPRQIMIGKNILSNITHGFPYSSINDLSVQLGGTVTNPDGIYTITDTDYITQTGIATDISITIAAGAVTNAVTISSGPGFSVGNSITINTINGITVTIAPVLDVDSIYNSSNADNILIGQGVCSDASNLDLLDAVIIGNNAASNASGIGGGLVAIGNNSAQNINDKIGSLVGSLFIGNSAGRNCSTFSLSGGGFNTIIGSQSAENAKIDNCVTLGHLTAIDAIFRNGTFIGTNCGLNANGEDSVSIGWVSGTSLGDRVVVVGTLAGRSGSNDDSVMVGYAAGENVTTGTDNIYIGSSTGNTATTGSNNTIVGTSINPPLDSTSNFSSFADIIIGDGYNTTIYTPSGVAGLNVDTGTDIASASTGQVLAKSSTGALEFITNVLGNDITGTVSTTDATQATLATFTTTANDTVYSFSAEVTGIVAGGNAASYEIKGTFKRVAGTVTQIGSTLDVMSNEDDVAWGGTTFDISGSDIRVRVTGLAATSINWKAFGNIKIGS